MTALSIRLNKRVTIQQQSETQDENGQPALTWTNFVLTGDGKTWAEIKDINGREFVAAEAGQHEVQTKILIRYMSGVIPSMRVLYGDDVYDIKAVLGQDNRTLLLMCSRGVSNG